MPDRDKIIEADNVVMKVQEFLRQIGWRVDKPHVLPTGVIICRMCPLPEGERRDDD